MNNKAQSTGFAWIYGLVILFGLGLLYIIFNQVFMIHIVPTIKDQIENPIYNVNESLREEAIAGIDKYMTFFHAMPFILFIIVVIYLIVVAIRRERESQYF